MKKLFKLTLWTARSPKACSPAITIFKELLKLYLVIEFLLRIVLMFSLPEGATLSVFDILKAFVIGTVNDMAMCVILCSPILFFYLGWNEWKYTRKAGACIFGLLVLLFCYVMFTHSIFHDYGGWVPEIAQGLIAYKMLSFGLRYFIPGIRTNWRKVTIYLLWGVYVFLLLANCVGEWLFWDEFSVRYNFIAVDYLIYTYEVIGNIMESYAIIPLIIIITILTVALVWWRSRLYKFKYTDMYSLRELGVHVLAVIVAALVSVLYLSLLSHRLEGENLSANQIQQNSCWDFVEAFQSNQLDYSQFYNMLPEQDCREAYRQLAAIDTRQVCDTISATWQEKFNIPEDNVNVVLITVESLSGEFLTAYGNKNNITPGLDTLMERSLVFDRLYATGNRTVRGLEALSLCIPPCAGESVVKRKNNLREGETVGHILAKRGYQVQFLYGGDSYFDNMGDFFGKNGYEVIDSKDINKVTFSNIWGVCDEDLYDKALQVFDNNAKSNRPFFAQIMTVSNHRPYTFPEGKIRFDGDPKCRDGAVKYTDYTIGDFLKKASTHSWFNNTIFIVIADHCASSAGKLSIPVDKYHIPCLFYAPSMIQPCRVDALCSQIDIIPTLLSLLHINEPLPFTGRNILSDDYWSRAFMATYQDLGYLENDILTVLTPKKEPAQYLVRQQADGKHVEEKIDTPVDSLIRKAQVFYQFANLYQHPEK